MSTLALTGVSKSFGSALALDAISLTISPGSRTAVVGPSGSGKTTLLRLIAGFEAPDTGDIRLGDVLIADAKSGVPAHQRNIGLVMQEGALFPHLSVLDNIRFGIRHQANSAKRAKELMDLVELPPSMAERAPHQLSGGQQQRVALARALARQPKLMLLDEPFSALDTGLRETLRQATANILSAANVATLLVTHDRDEAMSFADQLVVLRDGKLIQAGHPRDLYLAPRDATTALFLGEGIILDADVGETHAQTLLGAVPVSPTSRMGAQKLLIRPEQIEVTHGGPWTIVRCERAGSLARLDLTGPNATALAFATTCSAALLPGTSLSLGVNGLAHVLKAEPKA